MLEYLTKSLQDHAPDFSADSAELHGDQIRVEERGGKSNIGFWDRGGEWVSWKAKFTAPGAYRVLATIATTAAGSGFVVEMAGQQVAGVAPNTGGWDKFQTVDLGQIEVKEPGELVVKLRPKDPTSWKAINLRSVDLKRTEL